MDDTPPLLAVQGLSAGYTDEPVIRDVSLSIAERSITTIIGPNGAGKSTLLGALYGLCRRFTGHIVFAGAEIQNLAPSKRLKRGIGLVPQGRCNFPLMSVRENLELGTYSLPRADAKAGIARMTSLFPMLKERWRVQAGNLSGGEQQILEMAMVMVTAPRLLLLDEPSLGLSPGNLRLVFETIEGIRAGGTTVVLVEQNATAALRISDIAVVMELGRKRLEGAAKQVLADPSLQAAYLGSVRDAT